MTVVHADFTVERRYRQPPARAFRAFAQPELKRRWFAVPADWSEADHQLDFRIGGGELNRGRDPHGVLHEFRATFHEIREAERIVFAYDLRADARLQSVSLTTVQLLADGAGTRLRFTEHGAFFDELQDPAEREHGTGLLLDGLDPILDRDPGS